MELQSKLRLRPLRLGDEGSFQAAQRAMEPEGFLFGFDYRDDLEWSAYVDAQEACRLGRDLAPGRVPATFLVAEAGGEIVGRSSIRHVLNEYLASDGGHTGYCVLPDFRRRGYATTILQQSLVIARALGIDRILVTCDDDNVGSAEVIERCGGVFEANILTVGGASKRRYWID